MYDGTRENKKIDGDAEAAAREGGDDAADEEGYVAAVAIDADEMPG